jgi:putative redox protein
MKIQLQRVEAPFHFMATGSENVPVHIDAPAAGGGSGAGARPLELLLMGLAACSAIDVVEILAKQRLDLRDIKVTVTAERAEKVPAVFTAIHLAYELIGDIPIDKGDRAIKLSLEKYCSAATMLGATAKIDYTLGVGDVD